MMLGAPVLKSVKQYASFESQLRDIGVTGDLNKSQELQIGNIIRQKALETNQYQETLMEGIVPSLLQGRNH